MADILPTPRAILTSLINTLTNIPPAAPPGAQPAIPSNPLKLLPPSQARPLLATLHTLFPKVLLPALDLLDRRLVTRIIPVLHQHDIAVAQDATPMNAEAEPGMKPEEDKETPAPDEPNFFYLVRSGSAQQSSRRGRRAAEPQNEGGGGGGGSGTTYVVQIQPWNCSCSEFAFSAFPAESVTPVYRISSSSASSRHGQHGMTEETRREEQVGDDDGDAWEFGGISRDGVGVGTGGVPCCKHLLACVLAERWTDVLGSYVAERRVRKEEAAGLAAGI